MSLYFYADSDFNTTAIETQIGVGRTRLDERIQIFDDEINEAQEEFVVNLTVQGNFTVTYTRQTTRCLIPGNDRELRILQIYHAFDGTS